MKTIRLFIFFLAIASGVAAQNTDPLSYHNSHQLTDTSYSLLKADGDSTIFLFEGGNSSVSNYRTMSVNADSTQVIWQGGSQPSDTLEIWASGVTADSGTTTGSDGGNYHLPYNGDSTNYLGGDTIYHHLPFTSLTTTGINSNATLINGVLNIPNYANNSWNFGGNNTGPTTYQLLGSTNYSPVLLAYNIQSGFFGRGNSAAYGYDSYKLDSSTYTFSNNTAMGNRALHSLGVGSANVSTNNTALGYNALGNATTGYGNVALGSYALSSNSISGNNTFRGNVGIGTQSLFSLKNGIQTVAIGDSAFKNLSSGNYNIALGAAAAWNQAALSPYPNNFFYISDSTYHLHMKLDSATGSAPNVIGKDGNGNWHVYQTPSTTGGGTYTASNGLIINGTDIQLGGTLTKNDTLQTSTFGLKLLGNSLLPLEISTTNNGSSGIYVTTNNGTGISAQGGNSTGGNFFGSSIGVSTNSANIPIWAINSSTITGIARGILIQRSPTTMTTANGFGVSIDFSGLTSDNNVTNFGSIVYDYSSNHNYNTSIGRFSIAAIDSTNTPNVFQVTGSGNITFNKYGSGTFTGTPAKQLSVTSTGDIIETSQPIITSGAAAPSSTPAKVGDIYVDISNKKLYFAAGNSSSANRIIAN